MMNEEEDEREYGFGPIPRILDELIIAQRIRREFIEGCEEGYVMLKSNGPDCLKLTTESEAREALSRMLGHFTYMEEYEKCSFIKDLYEETYKDKITPIIIENIYNG